MNYFVRCLDDLYSAVLTGIPVYAVIMILIHFWKKRALTSKQCTLELLLCVYAIVLIKQVGIASLSFSLNGPKSLQLIPFWGSAFLPAFLNFLLFIPLGLLLPLVFPSSRWSWKNILLLGGAVSFITELLQLFGGRCAELEDLLMNALGSVTGYILYLILGCRKAKPKTALKTLGLLCAGLIVCFAGIYCLSDKTEDAPDGLRAVEEQILEVHIFSQDAKKSISVESNVFNLFASQLSNCDGHKMLLKDLSETIDWAHPIVEVLFAAPTAIPLENYAEGALPRSDRLAYDAEQNIIYLGSGEYQYCIDFMELDSTLEEHRSAMEIQYSLLAKLITASMQGE